VLHRVAGPPWLQIGRAWLDRLANHAITYTDAVSFAVMEALRCTAALTFDHDFLAAGFSRWTPEA
jgi:predicted nucleic acid-binding protein